MSDNVAITAGSGTTVAADEVVDGTLGTVKVQYVKIMDATLDGTTKATVGAGGLKVDPTSAVAMNTGTRSATTQRVTVATDDVVPASQSGTWTVQPGNTPNTSPWLAKLHDGTTAFKVSPASTAPVASDPAVIVALSPNGLNVNLSDGSAQTGSGHIGAPMVPLDPYSQYETVAASATDQVMGATGGQYDYIAGVLIIPGTSAAGAVSVKDGNGSAISIFAGGGTTALADLKPFLVPLGLHALAGTTPGWKITTGTNVTAIGIGKFT